MMGWLHHYWIGEEFWLVGYGVSKSRFLVLISHRFFPSGGMEDRTVYGY